MIDQIKKQTYVSHISSILDIDSQAGGTHIHSLAPKLLKQCLEFANVPATQENIDILYDKELEARQHATVAKGFFTSREQTQRAYMQYLRISVGSAIDKMKENSPE